MTNKLVKMKMILVNHPGRKQEESAMWEELGISGGTAVIILIALYFIVKWAVKNGIKEAWKDIRNQSETEEGGPVCR